MIYYTNEARESHISRISELIEVVSTTPTDALGGYMNAAEIAKYLIFLKKLIENEQKERLCNK